jgi:uncharacterized membrane protein
MHFTSFELENHRAMADLLHETHQEFWQPPPAVVTGGVVVDSAPTMAEVCTRCGTEFLLGSGFCHSCGARRPEALSAAARADAAEMAGLWEQVVTWVRSVVAGVSKTLSKIKLPSWLHYLHFHEIQRWIGLSTASLVAFIIGLACIAGALLAGLLNAKTFVDWQAIQFYRAEWLLGATTSFVAGILLKKPSGD